MKKRMEVGDPIVMHALACDYQCGEAEGMPQDYDKALKLWHRAAEYGYTIAYYNIGNAYLFGRGVEKNEKKAIHYWELSAMGGVIEARHNLGSAELRAGNYDRALKHYMIAVRSGNNGSLKQIKQLYTHGQATKDDYEVKRGGIRRKGHETC